MISEDPLEKGLAAYGAEAYEVALHELRPLAKAGHAAAQFTLGRMYRYGEAVPLDLDQAIHWLTAAAEQGCTRAKRWLVDVLYLDCNNEERSDYWHREAALDATDRSPEALRAYDAYQATMHISLLDGKPAEIRRKLSALKTAAGFGITAAQSELASWYRYFKNSGEPSDDDRTAALALMTAAAESGDGWAQYDLGRYYWVGRPADRDDAQAFKWFQRSADEGNTESLFNLGMMYLHGSGVARDVATGLRKIELAAERGCGTAMGVLADTYTKGLHGIPADLGKAQYWEERKLAECGPDEPD